VGHSGRSGKSQPPSAAAHLTRSNSWAFCPRTRRRLNYLHELCHSRQRPSRGTSAMAENSARSNRNWETPARRPWASGHQVETWTDVPTYSQPAVFTGTGASNGEVPVSRPRSWDTRLGRGDPEPGSSGQSAVLTTRSERIGPHTGHKFRLAGGHQRLAEAANIVAGHGNTEG